LGLSVELVLVLAPHIQLYLLDTILMVPQSKEEQGGNGQMNFKAFFSLATKEALFAFNVNHV